MTPYKVCSKSPISLKIEEGTVVFATGTLPKALKHYRDAFDTTLWANHHQPFSAAILHESGTELVLLRDHLGLEPIYFTQQGHLFTLYLGSNLPDLFSVLPKNPSFCQEELHHLFSTSHAYSDRTLYENVYRVEPGHYVHFSSNGQITKKAFWALSTEGEPILYQNPDDYVEHFSELLSEAIQSAVAGHSSIASEFSAGLDSTAVYCATHQMGFRPKLFMHHAPFNSDAEKRYQTRYEKAFLDTYPEALIERVNPDHLDLLSIFDKYAEWFKGPAPYLFFMFAYPLHQAVSREGYPLLLSGFGGDQGVSSPMPHNFFIPELMAQKNYEAVWEALLGPEAERNTIKQLKSCLTFASYRYPSLSEGLHFLKKTRAIVHNLFHRGPHQITPGIHPYQKIQYKTLRETEHSLLQGIDSHEIRMRIEYSSLVGKQMGFEYRYPLLHPKLLEFLLATPLSEKRQQKTGRYLIRRYLNRFFPNGIFSEYLKKEGLDIVPSTMTHYQNQFLKGHYKEAFQNLPFQHLIQNQPYPLKIRHSIKGYMLKPFYPLNP